MNLIELWEPLRRQSPPNHSLPLFAIALLMSASPLVVAAEPAATAEANDAADSNDVISLGAYNVKADFIEDFGLRVESVRYPFSSQLTTLTTVWFAKYAPQIFAVVPNTAAAKAGLQPGDRILKSEGRSMIGGPFSRNIFDKLQKKKWAEVAAGKANVTWILEIETPATKLVRTVKLAVPTPPPRWGASVWRKPDGRTPGVVAEPGPLAERSRTVLDNGIWTLLDWPMSSVAGDNASPSSEPTATGYEWHVGREQEGWHQILVTQFRGRTQVFFVTSSPSTDRRIYLTSPSGVLEKAWRWGRKENIALMKAKTADVAGKVGEVPVEEARAGFEHELDLWTTKVEKVSARWPFEVKPGYDPDAIFAVLAAKEGRPVTPAPARALAAEFLKLPAATDAQRALFADAYGKLGADSDQWAYTETSHGLEDQRVTVMRVDPSKAEAERCVLLSLDGKAPTPADVQRWRDDGGDTPKALGDLPPLASIVDLKDLRIFQDDTATVVFELPIRTDSADFPAEKFQALFRVNKTSRAFEDITVQLRDSFRVAGVVKVTEAGVDVHFQTFDPALAPQPVRLKAGGGVRVLFVKFSRSFEATRMDFKRVEPFDEAAVPAK
jgi:hypothetical protein